MLKGNQYVRCLIYIALHTDLISFMAYLRNSGQGDSNEKMDHDQFYQNHQVIQLQLNKFMKKGPQTPPTPTRNSLLQQIAKYILRGVVLGVIFQGTFLMLNFQNRIIRSVTSKRLQEVKMLEEETADRIRKGLKPLVDIDFLRDKVVAKLNENTQKIV